MLFLSWLVVLYVRGGASIREPLIDQALQVCASGF
jgi:hypothetical protein